ncbi:hypothetical protein [Sinosporangium siamense]|uniref:Uncharacterized protein n=1 Tax=Sinosporangium siamense TaxID=1367973 RepID=A0A919VA91_9ACTN|nr:hypothetical protein [Sinosporangium siamense]GII90874.1 hypothetical protein Ssi02_11050 [Sinosporangium siamense]
MKRWTTLAAAVLAAPALVAAGAGTATAAPQKSGSAALTPGDAVKRVLSGTGGVAINQRSRLTVKGDKRLSDFKAPGQVTSGVLGFGGGKVTALDLKSRMVVAPEVREEIKKADEELAQLALEPVHVISVGNVNYVNSEFFAQYLPTGKTWVSSPTKGQAVWPLDTNPNAVDPASLNGMWNLLTSKGTKKPGGTYDGVKTTVYGIKTTMGELAKAEASKGGKPVYVPKGKEAKSPVTIKIWLGSDQLPRRAQVSLSMKIGRATLTQNSITDLTAWGKPVNITAPDPSLVISAEDLPQPLFPGLLDDALRLDPKRVLS